MRLIPLLPLLLAAAAPAQDFKAKHDGKIYSYEYGWPKEAVAIAALDRKLRQAMAEDRREIIGWATSAYKDAKADGFHFPEVGYQSSWTWKTAGSSRRLLSLEGESYQFTGGAHGNPAIMSLLWDRLSGREMTAAELFSRPADLASLRPSYCAELDKQRRNARGGDGKLGTFPEFDQCPKFADLVVGIIDHDHDGRFDAVRFTANPYLAGPYSEGMYVVDLPFTRGLIAALRPGYRSSFEAQRQ
jgi:Deacetylase PdaC